MTLRAGSVFKDRSNPLASTNTFVLCCFGFGVLLPFVEDLGTACRASAGSVGGSAPSAAFGDIAVGTEKQITRRRQGRNYQSEHQLWSMFTCSQESRPYISKIVFLLYYI